MTARSKLPDSTDGVGAIALSRTAAGRATPRAAARLGHAATIDYRSPSQAFLALTRNPSLEPPARFEPTVKSADDIVI